MPYRKNQKPQDPPKPREPDLLAFPLDELERRYRRGWPFTERIGNRTLAIMLALWASLSWTAAAWDLGIIATVRSTVANGPKAFLNVCLALCVSAASLVVTIPLFDHLTVRLFRFNEYSAPGRTGRNAANLFTHLAMLTAFASFDIAYCRPFGGKFGAAMAGVPALLPPILGAWLVARAISAVAQRVRTTTVSAFLDADSAFRTHAVDPATYRIRRLNGWRSMRNPKLPHVERFLDIRKWFDSRGSDHATLRRAKVFLNRIVSEVGTLCHDDGRYHLDGLRPNESVTSSANQPQLDKIHRILEGYRQLAVLLSKSTSPNERRALLQRAETLRAELREAVPQLHASLERAEAAARDLCAITFPAEDTDGERPSC